jgi:hypothetical protein
MGFGKLNCQDGIGLLAASSYFHSLNPHMFLFSVGPSVAQCHVGDLAVAPLPQRKSYLDSTTVTVFS